MKLSSVESVFDIGETVWRRCAANEEHNPFADYRFFSALEGSGSAAAKAGWLARHLVLSDETGDIQGIVPSYLKFHSHGEYVFDQGWAEAFTRAGGLYYPKLQVSVPFTPVSGPRLLTQDMGLKPVLLRGLEALCRQVEASSVHITFLPSEDWQAADPARWLRRQDIQFHWHNKGFQTFEDFLNALSSSKRKMIRRERREVAAQGVRFRWFTGRDITEDHWDSFFRFYMDTGSRKWGRPYLNRKFFSLLCEGMRDHILLIFAYRNGVPIGGALNLIGAHALYGRNWGAVEHLPFLHFETCYYQAIEFAIANGLSRVEAGAQGEHKLARGYRPEKTFSLHHILHSGLARAVADYLDQERAAVDRQREELAAHVPFRHSEAYPDQEESPDR